MSSDSGQESKRIEQEAAKEAKVAATGERQGGKDLNHEWTRINAKMNSL
jgi:hypothetical protein